MYIRLFDRFHVNYNAKCLSVCVQLCQNQYLICLLFVYSYITNILICVWKYVQAAWVSENAIPGIPR